MLSFINCLNRIFFMTSGWTKQNKTKNLRQTQMTKVGQWCLPGRLSNNQKQIPLRHSKIFSKHTKPIANIAFYSGMGMLFFFFFYLLPFSPLSHPTTHKEQRQSTGLTRFETNWQNGWHRTYLTTTPGAFLSKRQTYLLQSQGSN